MFVCTGNICRSPMAEYFLRDRLGPDSEWRVCSAGLSAGNGMTASEGAIEVMKERDIDMRPHRSRPVDLDLISRTAVIVVMTGAHREQLEALFPAAKERVFRLRSFTASEGGGDIEDPIGLSLDTYRAVRDRIDKALPGVVSFLDNLCLETN